MELPIKTIVVAILALFVLAGVGIFFFSEASASNKMMDDAQCAQMCFNAAAQVATGSDINTAKQIFCENSCDNVMDCSISSEQKIEC